jgi:hypothetical protein
MNTHDLAANFIPPPAACISYYPFLTLKLMRMNGLEWSAIIEKIKPNPLILYRGMIPFQAATIPIGFMGLSDDFLKKRWKKHCSRDLKNYENLAISLLSGTIVSFLVTPSDLIMQKQQSGSGFTQTIKEIWQKNGFKGFLKGFTFTAARESGCSATFFTIQPYFKEQMPSQSEFAASLMASCAASFIGTLATQPLDVLKTRWQLDKDGKYKNFSHLIRSLHQEKVFMRGLGPRLMIITISCYVISSLRSYLS